MDKLKPLADWTNEEILEHHERLRAEFVPSESRAIRDLKADLFMLQVGFARQQRLIERLVGLSEGRRDR